MSNQEIKIVVCGPVDAGKSSLIGVLNNGILDNGRGSSRSLVLKHHHELESGRTSNITVNTFEYKTKDGDICVVKSKKNVKKIENISGEKKDNKIVNLIDLAGHERYLKTTVFGMLAYYPNYGIVVIGGNTGITKLTKEHLGIMLYLDIPFSIVITKIDITPPKIYNNLLKKLNKLLKNFGRDLVFIKEDNGTERTKELLSSDFKSKIPIISISNKTGINVDNLHNIIYNIPKEIIYKKDFGMVSLDSNYQVPGIGLVVCGTNIGSKTFKIKDKAYIGPYQGRFYQIVIRSIHNSLSENVCEGSPDCYNSYAIKFVNPKETISRNNIKKGMIMIDNLELSNNLVSKKFQAKIKILHHSTLIKSGYCPLIHLGSIRQSAKVSLIEKESLKTGDSTLVEFDFMYWPEFIREGEKLFFRDGETKGVGYVVKVIN